MTTALNMLCSNWGSVALAQSMQTGTTNKIQLKNFIYSSDEGYDGSEDIDIADINKVIEFPVTSTSTANGMLTIHGECADKTIPSVSGDYAEVYTIYITATLSGSTEHVFAYCSKTSSESNPIYVFVPETKISFAANTFLRIDSDIANSFEVTTETLPIAPASTTIPGVVQLATPAQVAAGTKTSTDGMPLVVQPGDGFCIRGDHLRLYTDVSRDIAYINTNGDSFIKLTNRSITLSAVNEELQVKLDEVDIGSPINDCAFNVYGSQTIAGDLNVSNIKADDNASMLIKCNNSSIKLSEDLLKLGYYNSESPNETHMLSGIRINHAESGRPGSVPISTGEFGGDDSVEIGYFESNAIGFDYLAHGIKIRNKIDIEVMGKATIDTLDVSDIVSNLHLTYDNLGFDFDQIKYLPLSYNFDKFMKFTGNAQQRTGALVIIEDSFNNHGKYVLLDEEEIAPLLSWTYTEGGQSHTVRTYIRKLSGKQYIKGHYATPVLITDLYIDETTQPSRTQPLYQQSDECLFPGRLGKSDIRKGGLGFLIDNIEINIDDYVYFIKNVYEHYFHEYDDQLIIDGSTVTRVTNNSFTSKEWDNILS